MSRGSVHWSIEQLTEHQRKRPESRVISPNAIGSKAPAIIESVDIGSKMVAPKGNRKVRNATKIVVDGITFDSKLEAGFYAELATHNIPCELQKEFVLIHPFIYGQEKVRKMVLTIDFWLPQFNMLVETKGYPDEKWKVKLKLLKVVLKRDYGMEPEIRLPSKRQECSSLVMELLARKTQS